jgi:DNA replication protein DnaC
MATGAWIDVGEPIVLLGDSGTGKTHLLLGLGLAACEQGRRVRYATTAQLVNELAEAADQRQLSRVVARYGRLDLLLLGYVQLDPRGAELLFQIITEREERASIAVGTNLPVEWGTVFPDPRLVAAIVVSRHVQRPHPRDRHPVLPARYQQDKQPQASQLAMTPPPLQQPLLQRISNCHA